MKVLALLLLLMLVFGENSSVDNSQSQRVVKREIDVRNAEVMTIMRDTFFNAVGNLMPQGWILNAVIDLFKRGAQSKPSLVDHIREEIQKGVMKGITNFYNDFLYTEVTWP